MANTTVTPRQRKKPPTPHLDSAVGDGEARFLRMMGLGIMNVKQVSNERYVEVRNKSGELPARHVIVCDWDKESKWNDSFWFERKWNVWGIGVVDWLAFETVHGFVMVKKDKLRGIVVGMSGVGKTAVGTAVGTVKITYDKLVMNGKLIVDEDRYIIFK